MSMRCGYCGKEHGELPLDVAYRRPIPYFTVPEAERGARCRDSDDLCVIDDEFYFVRGVLFVPIIDSELRFGWGLWAAISQNAYDRVVARWNENAVDEPPFDGLLAIEMHGYEGLLDEPVVVQLGSPRQRPHFTMSPGSSHLLAIEQRTGITMERAHEIVRTALPWMFE